MTDPAFGARREISAAVYRLTGGLGDPRSAVHDPLAALSTLTALRAAVGSAEQDAARRAREDGKTWGDIGVALGFADERFPAPGGATAGERAFMRFASDLGDGPSVTWECPSCGGLVADHGPELGNPRDAERGHAEDCERFAAEVAAWEESWRDE